MLGGLIGLGSLTETIDARFLTLDNSSNVQRRQTKEHILALLLKSSKKEPSGLHY